VVRAARLVRQGNLLDLLGDDELLSLMVLIDCPGIRREFLANSLGLALTR
jgi:hypothetical protein